METTKERAYGLILQKTFQIKDTVNRSGFCKPTCQCCLIAAAKGMVDEDIGIGITTDQLIDTLMGKFTAETPTDFAMVKLIEDLKLCQIFQ